MNQISFFGAYLDVLVNSVLWLQLAITIVKIIIIVTIPIIITISIIWSMIPVQLCVKTTTVRVPDESTPQPNNAESDDDDGDDLYEGVF